MAFLNNAPLAALHSPAAEFAEWNQSAETRELIKDFAELGNDLHASTVLDLMRWSDKQARYAEELPSGGDDIIHGWQQ